MPQTPARFPLARLRRMRATPTRRALVRETRLSVGDLIWPIFVIDGQDAAAPVASMPGVERLTIDRVVARGGRGGRSGHSGNLSFSLHRRVFEI